MEKMIVPTGFSIAVEDSLNLLKCKRCKQEFAVKSSSHYAKTVCFCPYCGQNRIKRGDRNEVYPEGENE